ncbi:MAG TPA: thiamine phosphate synthase [Usitatibacter sp.]|nr:thiamine phosphate synthase [Usitatibacter sp.]
MPSEPLRGLYAVTPQSADTEALVAACVACLEGGAALLQYRAKALEPALALLQARRLADACRAHGVPFIVNDSIPLALACLADGVHVGRDDASVREARIAFPTGIVGASCYADPALARDARRDGADYVAVGSMFASPTKPAAPAAPLAVIAAAREASGLPVVAIGGITTHNAPAAIAAGADMLAVISALFDASDIRAAARAFSRLFDGPHGEMNVRAQPRAV